jgi:6-phosphogluconolactonase
MPRPQERRFENRDVLARNLAASIAASLRATIETEDTATLVVSGGSTPRPLFAALSQTHLDWARVAVTLADERWVEPDDEASNESLVRRHLLIAEAAAARFVPLKNTAATPEEGHDVCETSLRALHRPFDVLVLGMGGDGHTASLFPGATELAEGLDTTTSRLAIAVHPPMAPYPRMSLTLSALLASRRIVLHLTGEEKLDVYERALLPGMEEELPIRAVLSRGTPRVELWWAP